ncbi:hypothetical protein GXN76_00845 [Kroppenstedtia pulmonis]|uniref:Uncharacterized protein n=1 Tax=Kroppenstedtia pulmonis TaxID=1380685 RepID=A0A7D3XKP0_9BACL|nr:hypothetical protein [Kroppenstedtia pulmonis]QKG83149.1 hypothetical protein GXN76_00845 [Kroppenstedtia pulmonis]
MYKEPLDFNAPILPGVSCGGLCIGKSLSDYMSLVSSFEIKMFDDQKKYAELQSLHVVYTFKDTISFEIHIPDHKLTKICTFKNYKGKLFDKIYLGMDLDEAMKKEPNLFYDEDEELFFIKGVKGVSIEADGYYKRVYSIIVYPENWG